MSEQLTLPARIACIDADGAATILLHAELFDAQPKNEATAAPQRIFPAPQFKWRLVAEVALEEFTVITAGRNRVEHRPA